MAFNKVPRDHNTKHEREGETSAAEAESENTSTGSSRVQKKTLLLQKQAKTQAGRGQKNPQRRTKNSERATTTRDKIPNAVTAF